MKAKNLSIFTISFTLVLAIALFISSCGKKDEQTTTEQNQQQNTQQQNTQQQNTQQNTQQQTTKTEDNKKEEDKKKEEEKKKEEDKKKEEEKKKKEEEKKKEDDKKKEESNTQKVNFSEIWPKKCAKCHGKDGKGKLEGVPDLTGSKTKGKSVDALKKVITNGKPAETEDGEDMPSFKSKLSEEEIDAAAKFVKGL